MRYKYCVCVGVREREKTLCCNTTIMWRRKNCWAGAAAAKKQLKMNLKEC